MAYTILGHPCTDGELAVTLDDWSNDISTPGLMTKEVLIELITKNVDRINYFEFEIEGEVEYMDGEDE